MSSVGDFIQLTYSPIGSHFADEETEAERKGRDLSLSRANEARLLGFKTDAEACSSSSAGLPKDLLLPFSVDSASPREG